MPLSHGICPSDWQGLVSRVRARCNIIGHYLVRGTTSKGLQVRGTRLHQQQLLLLLLPARSLMPGLYYQEL